jgi:hypothetical protein
VHYANENLHTTASQSTGDFCWVEVALKSGQAVAQELERLVGEGIPTAELTEVEELKLDSSEETYAEALVRQKTQDHGMHVGHPATIRAAEPRKQKHDRRDVDLILKPLVEKRFPRSSCG